MSEKIQMTEEQARQFLFPLYMDHFDSEKEIDRAIKMLRQAGHIRKSDLEILIEECDENHRKYRNIGLSIVDSEKFLDKLLKLVEMLKAELNKRRNI